MVSVALGLALAANTAPAFAMEDPPAPAASTPSPAKMEDAPRPKEALDVARAQQQDLRPQAALETVQAWLKEGGRTKRQTREGYALLGELFAQLDEGAKAEAAFQVVVRIDPSFELDDNAHASAKGPYRAALATKPEGNEGLAVTTSRRTVGEVEGIEVALNADDLGRISDCGLVGTATLIALNAKTPLAFIPLPPGDGFNGNVAVAILDEDGNTWKVARVVVEVDPPVRWLLVAGAATTFIGLFGASGLAIGYTAAAQANDEALSTALLAGVGTMSLLAAIGATLVVVDEVVLKPAE